MPTWITGGGVAEPIVMSHSEEESNDGATVVLRCPWADRHDVVTNIFANAILWPYWPETSWIPTAFSIRGTNGVRTTQAVGAPMNEYLTADITLTFGDPDKGQGSGSIGQPGGGSDEEVIYFESFQPSAEMVKLPPYLAGKWEFRWAASRTLGERLTTEEAPARLIIGLDYVIRWIGLTEVPDAFFDCVSRVNDAEIPTSVGRDFPIGTLLCQSPIISRTVTNLIAEEETKWDVEARFSYRRDGWNKFWSPIHGEFRSIYKYSPITENTGILYENFPEADFSGMLP
jgi:hypothetical protein